MKGVTKTQHSAPGFLITKHVCCAIIIITLPAVRLLASLPCYHIHVLFDFLTDFLAALILRTQHHSHGKTFPKAFRSIFKSVHREFPMEHDLLFVTLCLLYFSSLQKEILETKKMKLDGWWSVDLFLSDVDFEFKLFRVNEGSEKCSPLEAVEQLINDPNKSAKSGGNPTVFPWLTKTHLAAHITKGVFINKSQTFVLKQSGRRRCEQQIVWYLINSFLC